MAASSSLGFSFKNKKVIYLIKTTQRPFDQHSYLYEDPFNLTREEITLSEQFYTHHKELHAGLSVHIQLHFLFEQCCCPATDGSHSCCGCSNIYIFLLILIICYLDIKVLGVLLPFHYTIGAPLLAKREREKRKFSVFS